MDSFSILFRFLFQYFPIFSPCFYLLFAFCGPYIYTYFELSSYEGQGRDPKHILYQAPRAMACRRASTVTRAHTLCTAKHVDADQSATTQASRQGCREPACICMSSSICRCVVKETEKARRTYACGSERHKASKHALFVLSIFSFVFVFIFFFPVLFLVSLSLRKYIRTYVALLFILSNGQNRVHPEARWPKPGTPLHASPRAPSYWPTPAQTRLWPNFKRVHPILATHSPIGYPISITPTRLWPGYSTSSPHAHAHTSSRHRGTRRGISAVDVVVRAAEL